MKLRDFPQKFSSIVDSYQTSDSKDISLLENYFHHHKIKRYL